MSSTDATITLFAFALYLAITEMAKQDTAPSHSARWTTADEEWLLKLGSRL